MVLDADVAGAAFSSSPLLEQAAATTITPATTAANRRIAYHSHDQATLSKGNLT